MTQDDTAPAPDPAAATVLHRSGELLDVLVAQLLDAVAATEEAAFDIVREAQGVDARTADLRAAAAALRPSDAATADRIEDSTEALGERATALLAATQFQDVTRQSAESITRTLHALREQLHAVAGHLETGSPLQLPDDPGKVLEASYVSERQRAVHSGVTGGAPAEELAVVELF